MKALSIKQPWASLIAHGIKDIENRTWRTNFRGRVYIHASGQWPKMPKKEKTYGFLYTKEQWEKLRLENETLLVPLLDKNCIIDRLPTSAIIGEVDIIDCVINHPSDWAEKTDLYKANSKDYHDKIIYNWVLANPVLYKNPIRNVKGKLSFWEPDITLQICEGCLEPEDIDFMISNDEAQWFCPTCVAEYQQVFDERKCRVCGCTQEDCRQCIAKTGHPCHWIYDDLCSACEEEETP